MTIWDSNEYQEPISTHGECRIFGVYLFRVSLQLYHKSSCIDNTLPMQVKDVRYS